MIAAELIPWIFIFRYSGGYVIVSEKGLKYNEIRVPLSEIEDVKVMSVKDGTGDIKIVWKEGELLIRDVIGVRDLAQTIDRFKLYVMSSRV
ncbi:hypothetical protein SUSAZ_09265 [Sulfolobus acidocaldarius SUSAZ]|nr:hypothetical protein SUSAZ_09265 [Sulfolobus acidocaldarius SUSAZ]